MRFALYAGSLFVMGSNERVRLVDATASQLRRWIDEMGDVNKISKDGEVELTLFDNGRKIATRRFVPAAGRLHGWNPRLIL